MRIPAYAIIDRGRDTVRVRSQPELGRYTVETASPIGKAFTLPDPVGVTIDTVSFPSFADE